MGKENEHPENRDRHNLENAGSTLGKVYNVNTYESREGENRSRFMRVSGKILLILLAVFVVGYIIYLLVTGQGLNPMQP
ncbi:MAG: hypothetical protein JXB33_02835 [Clostridia bacterium]|nr:hypothetical protein [Clostridia bacterium]